MSFKSVMLKLFLLIGLLAAVLSLSACSFISRIIVANESNDRIQIRYVVKKHNRDYQAFLPVDPKVQLISDLDESDVPWRELSASAFTFNADTGTAVITLAPNEAVEIERISNGRCSELDRHRDEFDIEEISITGPSGAMRLTGEQVLNSFVARRKQTCVLTYR